MLRTDGKKINCFCCGAGDFEMTIEETLGYETEIIQGLAGREPGVNRDILSRVHSPAPTYSMVVTSDSMCNELSQRLLRKMK